MTFQVSEKQKPQEEQVEETDPRTEPVIDDADEIPF